MLLLAALLGSVGGLVVAASMAHPDTREAVINIALFASIVLQLCFGCVALSAIRSFSALLILTTIGCRNALLLSSPPQIMIGLLLLSGAAIGCLWWKQAKDAAPFTCASIDMVRRAPALRG